MAIMSSINSEKNVAGMLETALLQHPDVLRVRVIAEPMEPPQFVAFVLSRTVAEPLVDGLLECIGGSCADFINALRFVMLRSVLRVPEGLWERLPSGAIDNLESHGAESAFCVEELLASIWARALRTQRISRLDNFMDLGGQSLEAVKVVGRIKQLLNLTISTQSLFDSQTLADFARRVLENESEAGRTAFIAQTLLSMLAETGASASA